MNKKILITSALPYANGPLHFGHIAGAYLPADCYARYQRLMKNQVLYICGSDEYGIAITLSAEMAGRTPKEHVDIFHQINRDFFEKLQISFDHYSRTTWEGHVETTQQYFLDLLKNGYIEERVTEQLYSAADQKFLADRYVVGTCPHCQFEQARGDECPRCGASYEATDLIHPRSKLTQSTLERRPTKHWFLLLDRFKDRLNTWVESKKWKSNVTNFIKDYIDHLHARAITRDSLWGIPVPLPETDGKVLYVWFDAPIGYISATKEWAQKNSQPDEWKKYWMDSDTTLVQFLGKDNIPFHASIFPAMTMGQNQPYKLVDELVANEFYNLEGKQFSKSDGWYIDLEEFFNQFSVDQIRYVIAANAPETSDSEFTWKDFQQRCNSELLGKYGNLANRVLVFIQLHCQGVIPSEKDLEPIDHQFLQDIKNIVDQAAECYENFKMRRASQVVMELAQLGNVYFDNKRPWVDAKDPTKHHRMKVTLACCLECLKCLALISYPIIPTTANKLWSLLGFDDSIEQKEWNKMIDETLPEGKKLTPPTILFRRIEDSEIAKETEKLKNLSKIKEHKIIKTEKKMESTQSAEISEKMSKPLNALKTEISIDDVVKLDLRVGVILEAERVPKSKKLIKMSVDIGLEKRTILGGIGEAYQPEQLIGKKVVVVANLKPATLMGIQSEGMLLAAKDANYLELVSINDCVPGSDVC
ncbi:MAG: methionine--tRNA ligase [Parachlamydiaceae bacterium]|nr:methionine--tRNA ligase [Parachlamydiaceae bacterium]